MLPFVLLMREDMWKLKKYRLSFFNTFYRFFCHKYLQSYNLLKVHTDFIDTLYFVVYGQSINCYLESFPCRLPTTIVTYVEQKAN